jgi:hypothetical protein
MQIDPVAGIVDWLRNTQSNLDGDGASKERRYALAADEIERLRSALSEAHQALSMVTAPEEIKAAVSFDERTVCMAAAAKVCAVLNPPPPVSPDTPSAEERT